MLLSDSELDLILGNPKSIERVINTIAYAFSDIIYRLNPNLHQDPFAYFLYGHCATLARILYTLFLGNCLIYSNGKHVIIKIKNDFYDIRGRLSLDETSHDYTPIDYDDLLYLEDTIFQTDYLNHNLMKKEIEVGQIEMLQIIKEQKEKRTF